MMLVRVVQSAKKYWPNHIRERSSRLASPSSHQARKLLAPMTTMNLMSSGHLSSLSLIVTLSYIYCIVEPNDKMIVFQYIISTVKKAKETEVY